MFTLKPIGYVRSPLVDREEAFDATPIIDVKPVLDRVKER